jgi:hypothetical protein
MERATRTDLLNLVSQTDQVIAQAKECLSKVKDKHARDVLKEVIVELRRNLAMAEAKLETNPRNWSNNEHIT